MNFSVLATAFDANVDRSKKIPKFTIACPVGCNGELIVKDFGDELALICSAKCSRESIESAIQKRLEAQSHPTEQSRESAAGEAESPRSPADPPHKNKNGHYAELKAWIANNPERAYVAVLGHELTRKAGSKEFYSKCPLHDDHHPSLRINLEKTVWRCDPCNEGGSAFKLAGKVWGLEFPEVCIRFAQIAGLNGYAPHSSPFSSSSDHAKQEHQEDEEKPIPKGPVIRHTVRDLEGEIRGTHARQYFENAPKRIWWEPKGIETDKMPLFQIEKTIASSDGDIIIVTEGEPAAESLWNRRFLAVGTVTGAAIIPCDESLRPLLRLTPYLWPDNDEKGREHMRKIGERLTELGHENVHLINWKEAGPKEDAADFTGDVQMLIDAAAALSPYADRMPVDVYQAYEAMRSEPREYSWDGVVRRGSTAAFSGLMGAGKTTTMLNVVRGWAFGEMVLGRKCVRSNTLVVASPKEYDNWVETCGMWGIRGTVFIIESPKAHFPNPELAAEYFGAMMRRFHCETFALDTLFDFFGMAPNSSGDPNRQAMNEQVPLLGIVRQRGYSGIVGGHQPKGEARAVDPRDPEEAFAGHTGWMAQHRMRISLRRKSHGVIAIISGKGGYGDRGFVDEQLLQYDEQSRLCTLGGPFGEHLGKAALPSVLEALRALGKWTSLSKLTKEMGRGEKWIRPGLKEGVKQKSIVDNGKKTRGKVWKAADVKDEDRDDQTPKVEPVEERGRSKSTDQQGRLLPRSHRTPTGDDLDEYGIPRGD